MSIKVVDSKEKFAWGEPFWRQMRERLGPRAVVAFSSGKDAVAMSIILKRHFEELIPFCCYYVPGLKIMDEALAYYEDYLFERPIIRAPHPALIDWLGSFRFQTPEGAHEIARAGLPPSLTLNTIARDIARTEGLDPKQPYALGRRAGEMFSALNMAAKSGGLQIANGRNQWWPIWHMTREEGLEVIKRSGLKLSREYDLFHSSFCGIDYAFLSQLKRYEPEDWATVKRWFPLIEVELMRFDRQPQAEGGADVDDAASHLRAAGAA